MQNDDESSGGGQRTGRWRKLLARSQPAAHRGAKIGGELIAAALAVLVLTAFALPRGIFPVAAFVPASEAAMSARIGADISLSKPLLYADQQSLRLSAPSLALAGAYQAELKTIDLVLPYTDFLQSGRRVGSLTVASITGTVPRAGRAPTDEAGLSFEAFLSGLSRGAGTVVLPDIDLAYDGPSDIQLVNAAILAAPSEDGYVISASLPFEVEGVTSSAALDIFAKPSGDTDLQLTSDGAPIQPLLSLLGVNAVRLDTTFEGQVLLSVNRFGTPQGGAFSVRLRPGEGQIGELPFVFGENSVNATFDGASPRFDIENLQYDLANNRGHLVGSVAVDQLLTPDELLLEFDIRGDTVHIDFGSFMEGPLDIAEMAAHGTFDAQRRHLELDQLTSSFFGSAVAGALALTFPEGFSESPRIRSNAVLPGPLTPQEVLAGWPIPLAETARVWVQENLTEGQVTNLRYKSDIPMGAIRESVALPDETMRFTFDAADATVRYLSDMPPIRQLRASATVTGNSFEVVAQSGQISDVRLSRGRLSMPQFKPAGADALFEARLIGQVPAVLRALGEASLLTFEEDSYQPEAFQGFGQFDLSVKWPLVNDPAIEDVVITGEGSFAEGGIDNVLPGIDASRAKGRVILNRDRVIVRGTGTAASAPGTFEWRQALGDQRTADLSVSAEIDPFAADMIGLPLREFFDGVFTTQIYAKDLTPGAPLKITGELASAAIDIPALGLRKDTGVDAFFEATAVFPDEDSADPLAGLVGLSDLKLQSGGFNIEGDGVFTQDGGIVRLALPRFSIQDKADIALQLVNDSGNLDIDIKGAFAAAAPLLDEMFTSAGVGGRLPGRASLNIAIDEVALRSGVSLGAVKASGRHNGAGFDNLEVAAQLGRSDKLSITLDRPLTENVGFLEIESTDFGSLARGVFGVRSISGAAGSLKGATVDDEGFSGRFETGQLIIKDAPTLARILAIGSLDALADLLGGEGIRFDKLEGDVWLREGRIGLSDAKLVGSSLGISAAGTIDLVDGMIDMRGAIAPAYAINSVLGLLPGIGRLLVSRDGEGILAFAYQVEGPLDKPTVTVNTLTALTPGILRRIFEPVEGSAEETSKIIDAAIAEARRKAETNGQQNGGDDQPPPQPDEPQP